MSTVARDDGCTCKHTLWDESYHELHQVGCPATLPPAERDGFRPWASIEAGDLKAEYDRALSAVHASKMRAFLLSVRLDLAEQVCELADIYMGSAVPIETRKELGAALIVWRKKAGV